jgi:predicted nucleic acid-binding Zn ribbon protein
LKCRKNFEFFQSMKDDPLKVCPQSACRQKTWGKGKVKREIGTGAGLIFKGSGFYITDYRSENYKSGAKTDSTPAPSAESPAAKTDAAPAPKAESPKKSEAPKPSRSKPKASE